MVSEPGYGETRGKTNAEFWNEVNEALSCHENNINQVSSRFDQVHNTLQQVLTELQSMCIPQGPQPLSHDVNPFASGESFVNRGPSHHYQLKLSFPKFDGEDPTGWIYKAEQYFEFNEVPAN